MKARTIATVLAFALAGGLMLGTVADHSAPPVVVAGLGLVFGFLLAVVTEGRDP